MCKMMTTGLIGLAPRRKRAGYTQQAFADALGIERTRLTMWENRKAWPSAAWLPKMADLLCCDIDALYERPEEDALLSGPAGQLSPEGRAESIVAEAEG